MHDPQTLVGEFPPYKLRKKLHLPPIFDVWHHDPSGYDSETCGHDYNKLSHISHWEIRFLPYFRLMRKLFQRCALCGAPGIKKNPVNHGFWDDTNYPLYYSRPKIFHSSCMKKYTTQQKNLYNTYRVEGYNRGYTDGKFELADGTGYQVPDEWKF